MRLILLTAFDRPGMVNLVIIVVTFCFRIIAASDIDRGAFCLVVWTRSMSRCQDIHEFIAFFPCYGVQLLLTWAR